MAEQKKMTTAEILAMARQKAAGAAGGNAPAPATPAAETPAADDAPAAEKTAAEKPAVAAEKKAPAATGGARPSVADILAAARAAKGGAAPTPAAEKPAAEKPAPKPAVEKKAPAAAAAESPADKTVPAARDTASILAAARKATKPGPMSKAEAEASGAAVPAAKVKPTAPPMPAKPDYAKPKVAVAQETRRGFLDLMLGSFLGIGFTAMASVGGLWSLGLARFMFPNILTEPPSRFKVGFPEGFSFGQVEEKFKAQFGVWVVNGEYNGQRELYALKSVCTHLGCTPNWLDAEQKFKCPCHGSGFYKDGINFEGPAPRPLERYAVRIADDGQVEIDKSRTFQEELGQWNDPASFIPRSA